MKTSRNGNPKLNRFLRLPRGKIALIGIVILAVTVSCSLPMDLFQPKAPEEVIQETLAGVGLLNVGGVTITEAQVVIEYEQLLEEDTEVMVLGWLTAFEAAAEAVQDVDTILLKATFLGDPNLEITADGESVRSYTAGELSPEDFLNTLEINDLRPPEERIRGLLVNKEINLSEVSLTDQMATVTYYPAPAEDSADLMEEWMTILEVLFEEDISVETYRILAVMPDTSLAQMEVGASDLQAYFQGEINAYEFLASVQIQKEIPGDGGDSD